MVELATIDHNSQFNSLEVERAGRRFPMSWNIPSNRTPTQERTAPLKKLRERPQEIKLPQLLHEAILARLPWRQINAAETERGPLIEAYVQSLSKLEQMRQDVANMVRAACRANLEFRQQRGPTNLKARDEVMSGKLDQMLKEAAVEWLPTRNILNAALVSEPVPIVCRRLDAALKQAVESFTKQLLGMLARLVDRELMGLVEWHPNQCCSYHFFKRAVIQENDGAAAERVVKETRFEQVTERDRASGRQIVGKRTVEKIKAKGQHVHRLARHQHEVMNAIHTTIQNSTVVMPPQVVRLVEAVPQWLYPFIQVIDGDIFRERIIERDVGVESWSDVSVRDEPIIGCEPGVTIGPYVLTGWGPREVAAEQRRRQEAERETANSHAQSDAWTERIAWLAGSCVTGVASLAVLVPMWDAPGQLRVWAAVLLLLCIFAVMQVVWIHGTAVGVRSRTVHYLAALSIALGLMGGVALLSLSYYFRSADGWIGVALVVSSLVGIVRVHRLWTRATTT